MKKLVLGIAFAVLAVGCGDGDGQGTSTPKIPEGGLDANLRIVEACQGLPLKGMKYSPGGTVLPNKCAPFDQTTNNPYAIRCIDALPDYKTPFAGDQFCILPPPPELGIQIGLHPQGDAYWDQMYAGDYSGYDKVFADPTNEWMLQPGKEVTQNFRGHADNPTDMNYYRTYFRMRTGSHHNIITMHERNGEPDEWTSGTQPGIFDDSAGKRLGILGGEQRPDDGTPSSLEKPPEDKGQYLVWPANPNILFNMHHFNVSKAPVLREGWINIWWEKDDATVPVWWYMGINQVTTRMAQNPGEIHDYHSAWTIGGPLRLLRVFGHRHFWTTNFSAWIERKDNPGNPELIYQSFNWQDMPSYRYDSVVKNPAPNVDTHSDGAASGTVTLNAGDQLHFNCHVEYTDDRAATDPNAPRPADNQVLRFGNQVYNREMCIQFGTVTGGILAFPSGMTTPLPDFATK